ncbi:MAG: hypothetical protein A2189_03945 [Paenibacillus sp. RIFOXYA1_FULL_44_5]|nr:MAG: hypothetical protein A2189_03945 [Paenibacillus sp. RIFOXYA1_FULL_44_5]
MLSNTDLWVIFIVTAVVITLIMMNFKELFLVVFDEDAASVNGLPLSYYNLLLTVLTALVVGVSLKIVGALLVSSLLTVPVASSLFIGKNFRFSVIAAIVFSEAAVIIGLFLAGIWNLAPGGTIVMTLISFLLIVLMMKKNIKI